MSPLTNRAARGALALAGTIGASWCFFGWIPGRNVILGADALSLVAPWKRPGATMHNMTLTDPVWQFYPWLRELRLAVVSGRFPLWDPTIRAGVPIAANPISAYFFPLTWLVVPLGAGAGVSAVAVLRPALAAFFAFLYLRNGRHSASASLFGGLTYGFSLPFLVWAEHPQDNVFLLLPLLLMAIDGVIRRRSGTAGRGVAGVAATLALVAVAGHPESAVHVGLFAFAYSAVQLCRLSPRPGRDTFRLGAAALWAAAISLFIVYPSLLVVMESTAFHETAPRTMLLPLRALAGALWPDYFGNPAAGGASADLPVNFNEAAFFFGVAPLATAVGAFLVPRRRRRIPPPAFWMAGAAAMIVLIFFAPRSSAFLALPFLGRTFQNRLTIPLGLSLAALAAEGLDGARRGARARRACLAALAALAVAAFAIFAASPAHPPGSRQLAWESAAFMAGAAGLFLLGRRTAPAFALLCAGQFLDLWRAGAGYHALVEPGSVFPEVPILRALRTATGDGRMLGIGLVLPPNSSSVYGLRDVRGYDAVESSRFRTAREDLAIWDPNRGRPEMTATGFTPRSRGLLRLFSVGALLLPDRLRPAPDLETRYGISLEPVWQGEEGSVYRIDGAPGRFQPIGRLVPAGPDARLAPDPTAESAVEGIDRPLSFPEAPRAALQVVDDEPERVALRTSCPGPFFLRVSDAWDAGWRATIDGKPFRLHRADAAFRGLFIPAGIHRVEMRYGLPGNPGLPLLSLVAAIGLLAALRRAPTAVGPPATG